MTSYEPSRRHFLHIATAAGGMAAAWNCSQALAQRRPAGTGADRDVLTASQNQHSREGKMNIARLEAIALTATIDLEQVKLKALSQASQRQAILVRLTDDEGRVGESFSLLWGANSAEVIARINLLQQLVVGTPAFLTEELWSRMFDAARTSGWSRPIAMRAVSIVDCAIWDLRGKQLGQPLYKIWGAHRTKLPMVIMDSQWHPSESLESVTARAQRYKAEGYAGLKMKVGASSPLGPEADADRMLAVRKAVGPDFRLFADANQGWTIDDAKTFADRCTDADLTWFEEPCLWNDDKKSLARFRNISSVPIAAGQMEISAEACRDLMSAGSIDICNLDANIGGGATAWRRVAHMAQNFGISVVTHMDPQVGGHLAASVSNGVHVETYEPAADPFYFEMVQNRSLPQDGWVTLGDEPGWGWRLNPDFIARHRVN